MKSVSRVEMFRKRVSGLTQSKLGSLAGTTQQQINRLCLQQELVTWEWATRLAPHLFCDPEDLLEFAHIPVVGYVGPRGEIIVVEQNAPDSPAKRVRCPRGMDAARTAAVEVIDGSLYPEIDEGDFVFFDTALDRVPDSAIGHRCVVKLACGRMFLRRVAVETSAGRFVLADVRGRAEADVEIVGATRAINLPPDQVLDAAA